MSRPHGAAQEGREGVEAEWERSDAYHEAWKLKARDMLARAEWRRRKLTKRVRPPRGMRWAAQEADPRSGLGKSVTLGEAVGRLSQTSTSPVQRRVSVAHGDAGKRVGAAAERCSRVVEQGRPRGMRCAHESDCNQLHQLNNFLGCAWLELLRAQRPLGPLRYALRCCGGLPGAQLKEEEERIEVDEAETRKRLKVTREHHKKWEETRETRVRRRRRPARSAWWGDGRPGVGAGGVPCSTGRRLAIEA
jgi:hypothetical protein